MGVGDGAGDAVAEEGGEEDEPERDGGAVQVELAGRYGQPAAERLRIGYEPLAWIWFSIVGIDAITDNIFSCYLSEDAGSGSGHSTGIISGLSPSISELTGTNLIDLQAEQSGA